MAIGTCVFKGPAIVPFAGVAPLQPNPIPGSQWVTVVNWTGFTAQTIVHRVTVTPPDALVRWRRRGPLDVILSEGTFQQQIDFNIYPIDLSVTIDLWVDDPTVEITVTWGDQILPTP